MLRALTETDWKNIHDVMEFVLDSLDSDMIQNYDSVVKTAYKIEEKVKALNLS